MGTEVISGPVVVNVAPPSGYRFRDGQFFFPKEISKGVFFFFQNDLIAGHISSAVSLRSGIAPDSELSTLPAP